MSTQRKRSQITPPNKVTKLSAARKLALDAPKLPRETEAEIKLRQEQEKTLLANVMKIIKWVYEDIPYDGEDLTAHRSLEWLATEVRNKLNPETRYPPYDMAERDFFGSQDKLELLSRSPKASEAFRFYHREVQRFIRESQKLYATIGFAIGTHEAARMIKDTLTNLGATVSAQYCVSTPKPTEEQLQALDALARDIEWEDRATIKTFTSLLGPPRLCSIAAPKSAM